MFKMTIVAYRNPDVSLEEAHRWWIEDHSPIAKRMPGLKGYVINLAQKGEDGAEPEIMGTDDLYFDSREAADAAYASPEWQEARDDTLKAGHRAIRCWVEEIKIIDPQV